MRRNNDFDKKKIISLSTNYSCINVYLDAFSIEKVRLQAFKYDTKESIDYYLDFSTIALLASDAIQGRLISQLSQGPMQFFSGTKHSNDYNGPMARVLDFTLSNDKVYVNMSTGPGKLTKTGAVMPNGKPDKKVSCSLTINDFRKMLIYTHDCINAYLAHYINYLVREAEASRVNGN